MAGSIADLKVSLRRDAIAARRALADRELRCGAIAARLDALPKYREASAVLSYISKPEEADTHQIIERALEHGREVLAPRVANRSNLEWYKIESLNDLVGSAFGVLEPPPGASTSHVPVDAVALIPGVAFDRIGNRLGWGQGFFDRFLSTFSGTAIGLAFECQLYEELPMEPHDRAVAFVITETETITTGARTSL